MEKQTKTLSIAFTALHYNKNIIIHYKLRGITFILCTNRLRSTMIKIALLFKRCKKTQRIPVTIIIIIMIIINVVIIIII